MITNFFIKYYKISVKIILIIIFVVFSVSFIIYYLIEVVPPLPLTKTRMLVIERRIVMFDKIHNKPPEKLINLPEIKGYDDNINDGWGHEIIFKINNNIVTLISKGKDGIEGTNDDITYSFDLKRI